MEIENHYQFIPDGVACADPQALLAAVTRAGYSNTRSRRAVLAALCAERGPVTPAALWALGRVHHPALGLVTVYRTLEILERLGLVRKVHLEEGCHSYAVSAMAMQYQGSDAPASGAARHVHSHHVICQCCNRAVEFEGCDLDMVVASVEAQTGFRVREHWLEMFGLCPQCQVADPATRTQEVRR